MSKFVNLLVVSLSFSPLLGLAYSVALTSDLGTSCSGPATDQTSRTPSHPINVRHARCIQLGIENVGTTVVGRLDGDAVFVTQGYVLRGGQRYAALEAVSSSGDLLWRHVDDEAGNGVGEYIQWLEGPGFDEPLVLWTVFPPPHGGEGIDNRGGLVRARDGHQIHRFDVGSNNPSFAFDFDGDGSLDLIYCGQRFVSRFDWSRNLTRWTFTDRVFFCWSYPTVLKQPDTGRTAIVWGSEYNLPDGRTSSMVAIDPDGELLWKHDGIDEDLGSTPVFVADVDGDGTPELVKNGLDLSSHNLLEHNNIYIFSKDGEFLRKHPSLMYSTGIADLDGDGQLEAFGVVSHRDGGNQAREVKHLRCLDLNTGELKWTVPVPRVGLAAANALAADLDGDGQLEAIIADGNPVFYGRLTDDDWGVLYIAKSDGTLAQTIDLPSWPRRLLMCDLDGDGCNELIVQLDGRPASLIIYKTQAPATANDWPLPFGNLAHWGREHQLPE